MQTQQSRRLSNSKIQEIIKTNELLNPSLKNHNPTLNLSNNKTFQRRKNNQNGGISNALFDDEEDFFSEEKKDETNNNSQLQQKNNTRSLLNDSFPNQVNLRIRQLRQQQQNGEDMDEEEEKSQLRDNGIIEDQFRQLVYRIDHIPREVFNKKLKYLYMSSTSNWTLRKIVDFMNLEYDKLYAQQLQLQQNLQVKKKFQEHQMEQENLKKLNFSEDEDEDGELEFEYDTEEDEECKKHNDLLKLTSQNNDFLNQNKKSFVTSDLNYFEDNEDFEQQQQYFKNNNDKELIKLTEYAEDKKYQKYTLHKFDYDDLQRQLNLGGKLQQSDILIGDENCSTGMQTCESLNGLTDEEKLQQTKDFTYLFETNFN